VVFVLKAKGKELAGVVKRFLCLNGNGVTNAALGLNQIDANNGDLVISTLGGGTLTERIRLTYQGNFLLGTTSATANYNFVSSQSADTTIGIMVENLSNTVSASAAVRYKNSDASINAFTGIGSPTRAVYGGLGPNVTFFYTSSTAGMTLMVDQAGPITFYSGSPIVERARIASNGSLVLNPNQSSGSIPILDIYGGGSGALGAIRIGDSSFSGGHTNYWDIGRDNTTSGAFTFALNASEKMRIDTSGNVGIATTSPQTDLMIGNADGSSRSITIHTANNGDARLRFREGSTVSSGYNEYSFGMVGADNAMTWNIQGLGERMRLDGEGRLLIGTTSSIAASGGAYFQLSATKVNWLSFVEDIGTAGNVYCQYLRFGGYSPNDVNSIFLYCGDTTGQRMSVRANGGIYNYSANDSNLSDEREKKNIKLAPNYLNKICQIPVKTFLYNDQTDTDLNLGVIAQDVEAVCPELIIESNWAGKDEEPRIRKSIYQTDLQYALMKCIQEQQALIESLTTRLTALEGK